MRTKVLFFVMLLLFFLEARNYFEGGVTPTWEGTYYDGEDSLQEIGGKDYYFVKHKVVVPSGYSWCNCNSDGVDKTGEKPICKDKKIGICLEVNNNQMYFEAIEDYVGTLVNGMSSFATVQYEVLEPAKARIEFGDDSIEDYGIIITEGYEIDQVKNIGIKNQKTGEFEIKITSCFAAPADILGLHTMCNEEKMYQVNTQIEETEFTNLTPAIIRHNSGILNKKGIVESTFTVLEHSGVEFVAISTEPFQIMTDGGLEFYLESYYHCNGTNTITGVHVSRQEVTEKEIDGYFEVVATAVEKGKPASGHVDVKSIAYFKDLCVDGTKLDIVKGSQAFIVDYDDVDYPIRLLNILNDPTFILNQYSNAFMLITYDVKVSDYAFRDTENHPRMFVRRKLNTGTTTFEYTTLDWEDISDDQTYVKHLPNEVKKNLFRLFGFALHGKEADGLFSFDTIYFETEDLVELSLSGRREEIIDACICQTYSTKAFPTFNVQENSSISQFNNNVLVLLVMIMFCILF